MDETGLQVFIDGLKRYFTTMTDRTAEVGTPYIVSNRKPVVKGFSGVIGVSGARKGSVYFTAPGILLKHLLMSHGENDVSDENICDMVGEVANTISGNARKEFGREFMISVPVVVVGEKDQIVMPRDLRSFVIPITWRNYEAALITCFE